MPTLTLMQDIYPCGIEQSDGDELYLCRKPAMWMIDGVHICDSDILHMAAMNSDNADMLQPALEEIRERQRRSNP